MRWSKMSCLRSYLTESVAVFVTSDAQMVFLTIALAGSLCCSIIWRLFALLSMRDGLNAAPVKHRLSKHLKTRRLLNSIRQESSSGDEFQYTSKCFPLEKQSQVRSRWSHYFFQKILFISAPLLGTLCESLKGGMILSFSIFRINGKDMLSGFLPSDWSILIQMSMIRNKFWWSNSQTKVSLVSFDSLEWATNVWTSESFLIVQRNSDLWLEPDAALIILFWLNIWE